MRCELAIVYRPETGIAVTVVSVVDPELIRATAMRAVEESERAADAVAEADPVLGEIQRLEALRLRGVLTTLLPGFGPENPGTPVM